MPAGSFFLFLVTVCVSRVIPMRKKAHIGVCISPWMRIRPEEQAMGKTNIAAAVLYMNCARFSRLNFHIIVDTLETLPCCEKFLHYAAKTQEKVLLSAELRGNNIVFDLTALFVEK